MTETGDLLELAGLIRTGEARRIRETACLTAQTVAADLHVSPPTIGRWERGDIAPSRDHALAWLRLLRRIRAATKGHADG